MLTLSAYGFHTAVQMLRGEYLNWKPFNCKLCLSFWFALFYVLIFKLSIANLLIIPLGVAGFVYLIGLIEDRLTYYGE